MSSNKTIADFIVEASTSLHQKGNIPFTRNELLSEINQKHPNIERGSMDPIIQGMTKNLKGGASSKYYKNFLESVERGKFRIMKNSKNILNISTSKNCGFSEEKSILLNNKKIDTHQLKDKDFFVPDWNVNHLFLGTFNPSGGDPVNYFYGRLKNKTWELLSIIFKTELNPCKFNFFDELKKTGIACMDMISSVEVDVSEIEYVIGKGYPDSKIINNKVKRIYNTNEIISIVEKNPGVKVYSTWGIGSKIRDWTNEINRIENVHKIIKLHSPSMAARVPKGSNKFEYMLEDWSKKINT